jgi:endonuclease III
MKLEERADKIRKILRETYPDVKTQLDFSTPFQLLAATILSAQCTDKQVNKVTAALFRELPGPENFAGVESDRLEELIRSTGYYRNKAKNLKNCAKVIVEQHGGAVPTQLEELVQLPGVGRKTANVVLGSVFETPAIVVDTHVSRISRRLGFTRNKDPVKIEFDLMEIVPKNDWDGFSLRLIYFGREFCRARKPLCEKCPICDLCFFPDKTV